MYNVFLCCCFSHDCHQVCLESTVNHFSSWKCFGMTQYNHVFIFVCVCVCRGLEQSVRVLHVGNVTITPTRVEQINMKLALFLVCICIAQDVFFF